MRNKVLFSWRYLTTTMNQCEESLSTIQKLLFVFAIIWLLFLSVKQSSRNLTDSRSTATFPPELLNLPSRLCSIWFTTRDKKSRKFNLPHDRYRYGLYFQITKIANHTFMLILLAGDIATNPEV